MADTKISALTAITGANTASGDLLVLVDVSDTTMAVSGTDKKITRDEAALAVVQGGLLIPEVASPVTPPADHVRLFGRDVGGRTMLAQVGPSGLDTTLQPHNGRNRVRRWSGVAGSTTPLADGCVIPTAVGTATAKTRATTNLHQVIEGIEYLVTAASTTAVAGFRTASLTTSGISVYRGNASNIGGFHYICRWGPATGVTTGTRRAFVGLSATGATAPTDVNPSTLLNIIGMGWDAADTNVQIMHNDGAGTATKVGCGFARASADRTSIYELDLFCVANGSTVTWTVTELATGSTASGTISTDLVANTTAIAPVGYCSVGGTSSVVGLMLGQLYLETDF